MSRTTRWTHAPCGPEEAPSTSPSRQPPLTAHQLLTARLRAAWECLSDVAADSDLVPEPVRREVAQALAHVMEARAGLGSQKEAAHEVLSARDSAVAMVDAKIRRASRKE